MAQLTNLSSLIEKRLPAELVEFVQEAGLVAASQGQTLYLVGGVVRDLLLERTNLDFDLVVTGHAIALARQLTGIASARITSHPRFQTATLTREKWRVDLATARSEHYARPGALPTVRPGPIEEDLFRRDFTINAMAIELTPPHWGQVIDPYGGRADLEKGLIRVLHEDSFIDDATRIWRALRYEQRLDFRLEPKTLRLLKRDTVMLETVSRDRIRHELELVLKEERPEKVFRRADKLGVLRQLHPAFKGDRWLVRKFKQARQISFPHPPPADLYLALLAYCLTDDEIEKLISWLRWRKTHAQTLRETNRLKDKLNELAKPSLKPSRIYSILHDYGSPAITANYLATDSPVIKKRINLFLTKLRYVKPSLTGNDLQKLGVPPGPRMKKILQKLLAARLDGKVEDKKGEAGMVKEVA